MKTNEQEIGMKFIIALIAVLALDGVATIKI
jgi:hypothetical protein